MIAARSLNGVIGNGLDIPWKADGEQVIFKAVTQYQTCIVGRVTYETIKHLPNRKFIVMSSDANYPVLDNAIVLTNIDDVFSYCVSSNLTRVFIIGGAKIYKEFAPYVSVVHLTTIMESYDGNIMLPDYPLHDMDMVYSQMYEANVNYKYEIFAY